MLPKPRAGRLGPRPCPRRQSLALSSFPHLSGKTRPPPDAVKFCGQLWDDFFATKRYGAAFTLALTCGVATGPSALAIESCGMPSKRSVLELLNRAELLSFLDLAGLSVIDRRKKELLVDALSGSRRARLSDYLATFSRARLQDLCRGVGVDDSGREKAVLIDRITGGKAPSTLRGRAAE